MRAARGPLLAFFAFGAYWGAFGVLVPDLKEQVDASVTELGLAFLAVALAALPSMLVTGRIVDRVGPSILPPALAFFAAAAILPGLTGSVPQLALALALIGLASGAVDVVINVAATDVEASGGPRVMQIAHACFSGGFLVAAIAVGLARGAGAGPLPILAGVSALILASALVNRGYPRARRPEAPGRFTFSRRLVVLGLLCGLAFVIEGGLEEWSALFLETELDASPSVGGLGPGFFAAAMMSGRLAGQWLEVRLGDRHLLVGGGLTASVGLALAASASAIPLALLGFALGGLGVSVAAPTLFGAAGRGAPAAERGSAVASVTTVSYLGFLAGPPLIGAVSGALSLRAGIGLMAVAALVLALAASIARRALPGATRRHP
ncbi:MAG TPA: MFS transporter [Gaiellaceae bacterium]|nr:MFS transporter [Gaiellaceae bacterium]